VRLTLQIRGWPEPLPGSGQRHVVDTSIPGVDEVLIFEGWT